MGLANCQPDDETEPGDWGEMKHEQDVDQDAQCWHERYQWDLNQFRRDPGWAP